MTTGPKAMLSATAVTARTTPREETTLTVSLLTTTPAALASASVMMVKEVPVERVNN